MKKFTIFQLLAISMFFVCIFSFCIGYALCESKSGNIIWDKTFGGSENDVAFSIIQTKDGGCAISSYTRSKGKGNTDAWVIKLEENGNL